MQSSYSFTIFNDTTQDIGCTISFAAAFDAVSLCEKTAPAGIAGAAWMSVTGDADKWGEASFLAVFISLGSVFLRPSFFLAGLAAAGVFFLFEVNFVAFFVEDLILQVIE